MSDLEVLSATSPSQMVSQNSRTYPDIPKVQSIQSLRPRKTIYLKDHLRKNRKYRPQSLVAKSFE